jgi:hypothetical protein
MDPLIWGKPGWIFLFSIVRNFPIKPNFQQIHNYLRFFTYLQYVLPCIVCRLHYANHLQQIPIEPYLTSRDNLFIWLTKILNLVNLQLDKPILTHAQIMKIYVYDQANLKNGQINPNYWEKSFWKFLFSIAYEYPIHPNFQSISQYKRFFTYLQSVIPSELQRKQYANYFDQLPIDQYLTTRQYLFDWVLQIFNLMNRKFNQPFTSNKIFQLYFDNQLVDHQLNKVDQKPYGIALTEGFTSDIKNNSHQSKSKQINLSDRHLIAKNVSLAILVILVGSMMFAYD